MVNSKLMSIKEQREVVVCTQKREGMGHREEEKEQNMMRKGSG